MCLLLYLESIFSFLCDSCCAIVIFRHSLNLNRIWKKKISYFSYKFICNTMQSWKWCALFDAFLIICWHAIPQTTNQTLTDISHSMWNIVIFHLCTSLNRSHLNSSSLLPRLFNVWYLKFYTNIWLIFSLVYYFVICSWINENGNMRWI